MSSLRLSNASDYIEPAQACTRPPEVRQEPPELVTDEGAKMMMAEQRDAVTISLGDCLACSGCVTSAESVLVAQQTHLLLKEVLERAQRPVVMSLSAPSLAAIAARLGCTVEQAFRRAAAALLALGVHRVLPLALAQEISLFETGREFLRRRQQGATVPMLTSTCPGWICYAEKLQHDLLASISTTKSAQQMAGTIVRHGMPDAYHCCVMSCYDKKLEASREDFALNAIPDVDCVITTGELLLLLAEYDMAIDAEDAPSPWRVHVGSSAGGYLEWTLRYAARELHSIELPPCLAESPLIAIHRINADFTEYILTDSSNGGVLLRFAAVYGFRNIQNYVRRKRAAYDFIEIMACPGACLNGGGQPEAAKDAALAPKAPASKRELHQQTQAVLRALYADIPHRDPDAPDVEQAVRELFGGSGSPLLHTHYSAVVPEKSASSFRVQW